MAETHVITALHGKHARIKGFIRHHESALEQLRVDLDHVEATIRLFQTDWQEGEAIAPRKPSRFTRRGQGAQTALSVLRDASELMTSRQIALAVFERLEQPVPVGEALERQVSSFPVKFVKLRSVFWAVLPHSGTRLALTRRVRSLPIPHRQ